MADVQDEIALAQQEIEQANEALQNVIRDRIAATGDSVKVVSRDAAVVAAKKALTAAEIKLRKIYENKGDGGRGEYGG